MSNDNLNNKIINNVRNKIIISNIKGEKEKMLSSKKKILAIASCVVILAGGYVSVDAVNNGEITNTIKEKISSFVVKADGQEKELQPSKEENGYVYYEYEKDDKKIEIQVKEYLSGKDMSAIEKEYDCSVIFETSRSYEEELWQAIGNGSIVLDLRDDSEMIIGKMIFSEQEARRRTAPHFS